MAPVPKSDLLAHVEDAFRSGGWNLLYVTPKGEHPARYRVYNDDQSLNIKVYIWNISHGGATRSAEEYRIQITGLGDTNIFVPELDGKTLILGWFPNDEVFAGFDYRKHAGNLGGSPSFQINLTTLQAAVANRFASHRKGSGELAVAFRPDFIGTYASNLEALHDTGEIPDEVELLTRIANQPDAVTNEEISQGVAQPRRWAISQTRRALRALDFSERVLDAYKHRCAMCGLQLRLLDGAHILPVAEEGSTDETSNGVALCALHHRAYDRSLVTFDPDSRIHLNEARVEELRAADRYGGLDAFREALREVVQVPSEQSLRPRREFVESGNALRGWQF